MCIRDRNIRADARPGDIERHESEKSRDASGDEEGDDHQTPFQCIPPVSYTHLLEITVTDIRSDKGNVLAMAKVAGHEQPVYGMSPAKRGEVVVTLEGIDAETAEVSLLHDEDGDYKMKTGERGPAEGYAAKKRALPAERNAVTIRLRYPAAERCV